jgi:hypothetical protein
MTEQLNDAITNLGMHQDQLAELSARMIIAGGDDAPMWGLVQLVAEAIEKDLDDLEEATHVEAIETSGGGS